MQSSTQISGSSKNDSIDFSSADAVISDFRTYRPTEHAIFTQLATPPVSLSAVFQFFANIDIAVAKAHVRRVATAIARNESEEIRCFLVRQLYDELGNGKIERVHTKMFRKLMTALTDFAPAGWCEEDLAPGRKLLAAADAVYTADEPLEGIGAVVLGEIYAEQIAVALQTIMNRQDSLTDDARRWVDVHVSLEAEHADDSAQLTRLVSPHLLESVHRGGRRLQDATNAFFDEMYEQIFVRNNNSRRS